MAEECTVVRFSREPSLANIDNLKQTGESADKLNDCNHFGVFYVICLGVSIVTYILDLVLACMLIYFYSINGNTVYFALTLTFAIIPALIITTISLRWYIIDHDDSLVGHTSVNEWILRIIFLVFQLSPLLRYLNALVYGIKSRVAASTDSESKRITLYRQMLDEDTNVALLRLFHCFLHAAPQAVIQLVILLQHSVYPSKLSLDINVSLLQVWTVLVALISIAWSLTVYHRSIRYARDDKEKVKWSGVMVAFCWQLMSALSRVLALSLLATVFPAWMGCVCILHWGVMAIWLALGQHQTAECSNYCEELLLSTALGLAYIVAFISPKDGPTRYIYLVYYLVCFMENTGALVVWCVTNNSSVNAFLYYGAAGGQILAFLLAIVFLLIYYKYCHPTLISRSKIPNSEYDYSENMRTGYSRTSYNVRTRS